MPIFWRVFIISECWILSNAFSASIEIIIWFLSFSFLIQCITLIDFYILKNPCISRINPTWSRYMILLMCCWILFASILLRIFDICLSVILACNFLFWWYHCLLLVSGWSWHHINWTSLGVFLPLQFFGRVWAEYMWALP